MATEDQEQRAERREHHSARYRNEARGAARVVCGRPPLAGETSNDACAPTGASVVSTRLASTGVVK
jgi:hypothetical protein